MTAGTTRRSADAAKLRSLAAGSGGAVVILESVGNPPTQYKIRLKCRTMESCIGGSPKYRDSSDLRIALAANHPFGQPVVTLLTPIFNPHIFASGQVCLGLNGWKPSDSLDVFVKYLARVLVWDPIILDEDSPANHYAMDWARRNRSLLPLGPVILEQPLPAKARIVWKDQ